jgi:hypothetical protein
MFAASKTSAAPSGAPPASTDPQFNYVSLLLNDTGTNGKQNNTFLDSSSNNFTVTRTGTPTQGSVTPYWPEGQWSNYFGGTGNYIQASGSQNINLLGNSDFTIEAWVYSSTSTFNQTIISTTSLAAGARGFGWNLRFETGYNIKFYVGNGTGADTEFLTATSTGITINTWNHIAVVRNGATVYVYVNGVQKGSAAMPATYNLTGTIPCQLGQRGTTLPEPLVGYVSNARIVNGTALYTSNFTPSTTPLTAVSGTSLLTCQSNRFKDNSSNNFAITVTGTPTVQAFEPFSPAASYDTSVGGSTAITAASSYLTFGGQSAFSFNADFTVEMFFYLNGAGTGTPKLYESRGSGQEGAYVTIEHSSTSLVFRMDSAARITTTVVYNTWNHVAVVRSGTTITMYLNGTSVGTYTKSGTTLVGTSRPCIGAYPGFDNLNGYISNLRVVKGTAVYTGNFTPPTSPVTAITGTSLLLNFTNAGIYNAATLNDLVTVGNAQVSTAQAKFGSSSMAFDGTGDWLTFIDSPVARLETGNFTIEGWVYLSTTGTAKYVAAKGTSTTGWALGVNSSNQLVFNYTSSTLTSSTALSSGQWYHIAVVRNGTATGNVKIYLGGTTDATSGGAINDNFNQTSIGYVGADRTGANAMNGYLEDIRITKGYARYTANFTPPTAPFPTR